MKTRKILERGPGITGLFRGRARTYSENDSDDIALLKAMANELYLINNSLEGLNQRLDQLNKTVSLILDRN